MGTEPLQSRRRFLLGVGGLALSGLALSSTLLTKLIGYVSGDKMSQKEKTRFLKTKLSRIDQTLSEKRLEVERKTSDFIFVAKMNELTPAKGKYFIDYSMKPALAFQTADGMPLLISAKCTHLGCTVGCDLDQNNRILCPCHISYFDITTGKPNEGAPAKEPLPHLGWVIMDSNNTVVLSKSPKGELEKLGELDMSKQDSYSIYIAKKFEEVV